MEPRPRKLLRFRSLVLDRPTEPSQSLREPHIVSLANWTARFWHGAQIPTVSLVMERPSEKRAPFPSAVLELEAESLLSRTVSHTAWRSNQTEPFGHGVTTGAASLATARSTRK